MALAAALCALPTPEAQTLPPGEGFEWEILGDPKYSAHFIEPAWDGNYWASGADIDHVQGIYRYDEATNDWVEAAVYIAGAQRMTFLGPDTLLIDQIGIRRSIDGGQTWEDPEHIPGFSRFIVAVPLGLPHSGGLVLANTKPRSRGGNGGVVYSTDRGRRFEQGAFDPALFGTDDIRTEAAHAVSRGPHGGRLLCGGLHGVALSDDGARSWRPSGLWTINRYWIYDFAEVERADGGLRLLVQLEDLTQFDGYVAYSDDGGETWSEPVPLPDARDGGIGHGTGLFASIPDSPQSVVAVMARGHVYRSDDSGATWSLLGRVPVEHDVSMVRTVLVDAEGRLVVAAPGGGNGDDRGAVYRTAEPLPVSSAGEPPPEASGAVLRVSPNPSRGAVRIEVSGARLPEAVQIVVVDARGREVARRTVRASGAKGAEVSTAGWAPGVYVARAVVGGETVSARFTVAR